MMTLEQHREYVREKLRKWGEISRIMFRQNIEAALLDPKSIYSAMPDIEKMRARILYGYRLPAAQLTEDELLQIYRAMAFAKEIARDCLEDAG